MVQVALGFHPQEAAEHAGELREFEELLPSTRFVGEVSLDYYFCDRPLRAVQRRVFERIVEKCD